MPGGGRQQTEETMLKLVIGNHNYSSWSLRAWLYLRASGLDFELVRIPMFTPTWRDQVAEYTPAGRVPVLIDGDLVIWDSMAIITTVMEEHPRALGWPLDRAPRAEARSIANEMHSGFLAIRDQLPQNLRARTRLDPAELSPACSSQIERVIAIWSRCRQRHRGAGPWLFGDMSVADVMFAPVALRFVTYSIPVPAPASEFIDAVQGDRWVREWIDLATAESERIDFIDELVPQSDSPLVLG